MSIYICLSAQGKYTSGLIMISMYFYTYKLLIPFLKIKKKEKV